MFERVYVINLKRRPDRLREFRARLAKCDWPFAEPIVYPAIEGDKVGVPREFTQGGGAYGCRMSHLRILQDCLMEDVESVLILEDDADLRPGFGAAWRDFYPRVPDDWDGIMLGGQHHASPDIVPEEIIRLDGQGEKAAPLPRPGVLRVHYAQRTHAYGARRSYMRALQERWGNGTVHIDWMMRDWQHKQRVYCPERWMVGQAGGRSDIRGATKPAEWWTSASGDEPVVLLRATRPVMEGLQRIGWHGGFDRDPKTGIDVGLPRCFDPHLPEPEQRTCLTRWLWAIQSECLANRAICTVWHPRASLDAIRAAWKGPAIEIAAKTVKDAESKLPAEWRERSAETTFASIARPVVVLLRAEKDVAERLTEEGWHIGYWRDPKTGLDRGLQSIFGDDSPEEQRIPSLQAWLREVGSEAIRDGKILTVWHPAATAEMLQAAGAPRVTIIEATSAEEAMRKYLEV